MDSNGSNKSFQSDNDGSSKIMDKFANDPIRTAKTVLGGSSEHFPVTQVSPPEFFYHKQTIMSQNNKQTKKNPIPGANKSRLLRTEHCSKPLHPISFAP